MEFVGDWQYWGLAIGIGTAGTITLGYLQSWCKRDMVHGAKIFFPFGLMMGILVYGLGSFPDGEMDGRLAEITSKGYVYWGEIEKRPGSQDCKGDLLLTDGTYGQTDISLEEVHEYPALRFHVFCRSPGS